MTSKSNHTIPNWPYVHFLREVIKSWRPVPPRMVIGFPVRKYLELTILPPWYRTWWFILCCAVFIAAAIIEAFRRAWKRKEEKLKWAMKEHEQQVYEEKVRFLINISHELRTPLTLIYAPLNRMLKSLSTEDTQYLPIKAIYRQAQRMKNLLLIWYSMYARWRLAKANY